MQQEELKDTIKAIDTILAAWAEVARRVLNEDESAEHAFEVAQDALALVQLKEYFEHELYGY